MLMNKDRDVTTTVQVVRRPTAPIPTLSTTTARDHKQARGSTSKGLEPMVVGELDSVPNSLVESCMTSLTKIALESHIICICFLSITKIVHPKPPSLCQKGVGSKTNSWFN